MDGLKLIEQSLDWFIPVMKNCSKENQSKVYCSSVWIMHVQEMLSKVRVMKDQKGEQEEKRQKNAQKEDMRGCVAIVSVSVRVKENVQQLV